MHILLTNDDGIEAAGLKALTARVRALGRVTVAAPDRERSGVGHAITLDGRLGCRRLADDGAVVRYAVAGTPADCVKLAVSALVERPIDLVLSGVNAGGNAGVSALYSGTVAGAIEAAMVGLPAVAISLADTGDRANRAALDRAADIAVGLIEHLLRAGAVGAAPLNINVPPLRDTWPIGWRVTRQSLAPYRDAFTEADEADAFCLETGETRHETDPDTDLYQLLRGYVTVTPLGFDLTDRRVLADLRRAADVAREEA